MRGLTGFSRIAGWPYSVKPKRTMLVPMKQDEGLAAAAGPCGRNLAVARRGSGMSVNDLARATGVGRRRVRAIERGSAMPTSLELEALADACGVSVTDLVPPGSNLRLLDRDGRRSGNGALEGELALDALLREYISMVLELRNAERLPASTLREEDLVELARALGGSPEAIEARLIELLGTDAEGA
ncbi:MAG TPA: helix-turn-helix transcriptional regulator, partial [Acidimicrobiia bacterium]|nr:helix-turn-helix transcriptional regulator [Acidimicrobiia bacterium]